MKGTYFLLLLVSIFGKNPFGQWETQSYNFPILAIVGNVDMVNADAVWARGWIGDFTSNAWSCTNPLQSVYRIH
jgi:hypothetical protein